MIVKALMPAIHDRLTGGSVYNRKILAHLETAARLELCIDSASEDHSRRGGGLWVVDSLCLHEGARQLKQDSGVGVLIAHYLHVLDPRYADSDIAARELESLSCYRAVVTTSRFARDELRKRGIGADTEVVSPGLDIRYRTPIRDRRADGGAILTVANLVRDKGVLEMLQCLEQLAGLSWSWEMIGDMDLDPAFTEEFRRALDRSPVRERIVMKGIQSPPEVLAAYDRSSIFALPSRFETCSIATMEAMARGLPVVACRTGGLPDLLPESSRQFLAEPQDIDHLTASLRLLLSDGALRRSHGEANRAASERFPSWEQSCTAFERLLRCFWPHEE